MKKKPISLAASELGKKSAQRFKNMSKEERSEYMKLVSRGITPPPLK